MVKVWCGEGVVKLKCGEIDIIISDHNTERHLNERYDILFAKDVCEFYCSRIDIAADNSGGYMSLGNEKGSTSFGVSNSVLEQNVHLEVKSVGFLS